MLNSMLYHLAGINTTSRSLSFDRSVEAPFSSSCDSSITNPNSNPNYCRTKWNIVISCLVTIFASTYISIHPNINEPFVELDPNSASTSWEGIKRRVNYGLRALWKRLFMIFLGIFYPEYILAWAVRQATLASRMAQEHGWTKSHGHFMIMGGFHLFVDSKYPLYPLHRETVEKLVHQNSIKLPTLREIQDKSKKGGLIELLALIQASWFIVSTISRATSALTITKLELVTIAHISITFVIYCVWWDKPRNVDHPIRIPVEQVGITATKKKRDHTNSGFGIGNGGRKSTIVSQKVNYAYLAKKSLQLLYGYEEDSLDVTKYKAVPIFYSGKPRSGRAWQSFLFTLLPAVVRSAILSIAWSYGTHQTATSATATKTISLTELVLWRVSTLAIFGFLAFFILIAIATTIVESLFRDSNLFRPYYLTIQLMLLSLGAFYVMARNLSFVLALMELRSVSADVYETVYWTSSIPHI